jgi:hypothetical protein
VTSPADLLAHAKANLGFIEGPRDNETPFGEWAGAPFQPWCQSFASKMLDEAGLGVGRIAYCPAGITYWKAQGRLYASPQAGDLFYLWFPGKGRYAHVGLVDRVEGDWIVTVEGNSNAAGSRTGGMVCQLRRRWAGTRTVFGRPPFDGVAAYTPPPAPPAVPRVVLKRGSKGPAVKLLQARLNTAGAHLGVDGDFGPGTLAAVKAFQVGRGLAADGIVGAATWKALG